MTAARDRGLIDRVGLARLLSCLRAAGYGVIGPKLGEGAIVYDRLEAEDELPTGFSDEQEGGRYRLTRRADEALFAYVVGPQSWKRHLYPPHERLWQARADEARGWTVTPPPAPQEKLAFFGVRACDLKSLAILDRVIGEGRFADPAYVSRRGQAFIVAVNCWRPGGTCFCASMGSGPRSHSGYDLALTELHAAGRGDLLIEAGSERGTAILAELACPPADAAALAAADEVMAQAGNAMGRTMVEGVAELLRREFEHPRWAEIAERCLACANCTLVCPTCFCTTIEDTAELDGSAAERTRRWDSCFTLSFSYLPGGSLRADRRSRYRQWMTHKLSSWHDQFGTSGCVGCGRCITWCPVGIDITVEAQAIKDGNNGG